MEQAQRDAFTQNWDQAKDQVKTQFGLDDKDLGNGKDVDQLVDKISEQTGADRTAVEQELDKISRQYTAPEQPEQPA